MARLSLTVLALCLFLAVLATALPAVQDNRPSHMIEEMADSASPTPTNLHALASSATPNKASPSAKPSSAPPTAAPPQETISDDNPKGTFDSIPFFGQIIGSLLGS